MILMILKLDFHFKNLVLLLKTFEEVFPSEPVIWRSSHS